MAMFLRVACGLSQRPLWGLSVQLFDFHLCESLYDSCLSAAHLLSSALCVGWEHARVSLTAAA